jgi:hypothetical protein
VNRFHGGLDLLSPVILFSFSIPFCSRHDHKPIIGEVLARQEGEIHGMNGGVYFSLQQTLPKITGNPKNHRQMFSNGCAYEVFEGQNVTDFIIQYVHGTQYGRISPHYFF